MLSGLRIWRSCELWCRSQTRLGSDPALLWLWCRLYSSDSTPSQGTPCTAESGFRKGKKTHTHTKKESIVQDWGRVLVPPQGIHIMMQASYTPKRKVIFPKLLLEMKSSETNSYNWIIWSPFLCFSKHNRTLNTIAYELKIRCS